MTNPELEVKLLGCMMFSPADVFKAQSFGVSRECFSVLENAEVFQAILFSAAKAVPTTDADSIWQAWTGMSGDPEGKKLWRVVEISRGVSTSIDIALLSEAVVGLWKQRRLVGHLSDGLEAAKGVAASWEGVLEATSPHLRRIEAINSLNRLQTISELAAAAKKDFDEPDMRRQVSTGLRSWDRMATAPRAGQMIVIAGYTGSGKSAFAVQVADHIAATHGAVLMFSFEMTAEEIIGRIARQRAGETPMRSAISAAYDAIGAMKTLTIFDASTCPNIVQLEGLCRAEAAKPLGLSAIVVDYIQQVQADPETMRGKPNREQVVASITRRLKMLALTLKVSVFALSQINNESIRDDRQPRLSDVRESMAIANDADRVWFIYASPQPKDSPQVSEIQGPEQRMNLMQEKCRGGPAHIATTLRFHKPSFTFKP